MTEEQARQHAAVMADILGRIVARELLSAPASAPLESPVRLSTFAELGDCFWAYCQSGDGMFIHGERGWTSVPVSIDGATVALSAEDAIALGEWLAKTGRLLQEDRG